MDDFYKREGVYINQKKNHDKKKHFPQPATTSTLERAGARRHAHPFPAGKQTNISPPKAQRAT